MIIHTQYYRIDRPMQIYNDELLADDGWRVRLFTRLTPQDSLAFSEHWIKGGLFAPGSLAVAVAKYVFPGEPFAIVEPFDSTGASMGVYVDICLPVVRRSQDSLELYDMMLDLWFPPSGPYQELDWDEFEQARLDGKMTPENASAALQTMDRLRQEIAQDRFPQHYIKPY